MTTLPGLAGSVVIVTGAAGGIGGATAEQAVRSGMRVVAVDVVEKGLADLVERVADPEAIVAYRCDLADVAALPGIVSFTVERFGTVDGLVHAAAILRRQTDITSVTEEDWNAQVDVNQRGTWFLVREVAESMRREGREGAIVIVASAGAFTGGLGGSWVYSATKGAIVTMVRGFGRTYAPYGIRVNAVSPGTVNTKMLTRDLDTERLEAIKKLVPLGRVADPVEVGTVALFLLSEWSSYVAGVTIDVDGAWLTR